MDIIEFVAKYQTKRNYFKDKQHKHTFLTKYMTKKTFPKVLKYKTVDVLFKMKKIIWTLCDGQMLVNHVINKCDELHQ